jgi:hypothetical protein
MYNILTYFSNTQTLRLTSGTYQPPNYRQTKESTCFRVGNIRRNVFGTEVRSTGYSFLTSVGSLHALSLGYM